MIEEIIKKEKKHSIINEKIKTIELYLYKKMSAIFSCAAFLFGNLILWTWIFIIEKKINEGLYAVIEKYPEYSQKLQEPFFFSKIAAVQQVLEKDSYKLFFSDLFYYIPLMGLTFIVMFIVGNFIFLKCCNHLEKQHISIPEHSVEKISSTNHILAFLSFFVLIVTHFLFFDDGLTLFLFFIGIIFTLLFTLFISIYYSVFVLIKKNKAQNTIKILQEYKKERDKLESESMNMINEIISTKENVDALLQEYEVSYQDKNKRRKIEDILKHLEVSKSFNIEKQNKVDKYKKMIEKTFNEEVNTQNLIINE